MQHPRGYRFGEPSCLFLAFVSLKNPNPVPAGQAGARSCHVCPQAQGGQRVLWARLGGTGPGGTGQWVYLLSPCTPSLHHLNERQIQTKCE